MTEPTTAAGRALLDLWIADTEVPQLDWLRMKRAILAIEAEARQQDGSALREAVEKARATLAGLSLPLGSTREAAQHERDTALALIDAALAALPPSAPPALEVERLARALYEDAIASYRRKKLPSWFEMVAHPSLPMGTTGRDKDETRRSMLESWRGQARRILARLEPER